MNLNQIISQCGGRRFLLVLGCGIACSFLVWHAKITSEAFSAIIIATVGVYISGNTYQKVKNANTEHAGD